MNKAQFPLFSRMRLRPGAHYFGLKSRLKLDLLTTAPDVQTLDSTIRQLNRYPAVQGKLFAL